MHERTIEIGDVTLRDAHQSLLATRLRLSDMLPAIPALDRAGFAVLEAWGGATYDACMRFCDEDPWERLLAIRKAAPNSRIRMLVRGQSLVGYRHFADDVVDLFISRAAAAGVEVFRVFDALNDVRNLERPVRAVLDAGGEAEGAISYTTSPVHTIDTFVRTAAELAALGCSAIAIKDMAGLLAPAAAFDLVRALRRRVGLPVVVHTHCTNALAEAACMAAAEAGADVLDGAVGALAGGSSLPAVETLATMAESAGRATRLDLDAVEEASAHMREARARYRDVDTGRTGVDGRILRSQIPGGMLSNLVAQLRDMGASERLGEVLDEVPRVRAEMGYPPLVTPSSQIVGAQATLNVVGGARYAIVANETRDYFRGLYGRPPAPVDPDLAARLLGGERPTDVRPADILPPEVEPARREYAYLRPTDEDVLSLVMFPAVARKFIAARRGAAA